MRIAVAGGTGMVGGTLVRRAQSAGHDTVVLSRSTGVDLTAVNGPSDALVDSLAGVEAVVDATNVETITRGKAVSFFETVTRNLLAAEGSAGVGHHVALSIVGIDRIPFGYYLGKRAQEELVVAGAVPWTVLRATQFHEFPGQLLGRIRGPVVPVPRMRTATVAADEVAERLLTLATAPPAGRAAQLAGPEVLDMAALTRQVLRHRGSRRLVVSVRQPGAVGREMAGDGLLPRGDVVRGRQTFDEWLREH